MSKETNKKIDRIMKSFNLLKSKKILTLKGSWKNLYNILLKDTSLIFGLSCFIYMIVFTTIISLFMVGIKTDAINEFFNLMVSASFIVLFVYLGDKMISRSNGIYQYGSIVYICFWLFGLINGNYILGAAALKPIIMMCFVFPSILRIFLWALNIEVLTK